MRVRCFGVLLLIHTAALANVTTTKNNSTTINVTNATKNEVLNVTKASPSNDIKVAKLKISRRRNGKSRSTSSSSGEKVIHKGKEGEDKSSLEIQSSDSTTAEEKNQTTFGTGWRRWHRKCTPCPGEMGKRWREPSIQWICGGFQRARRSFKSECMMHFRNCQDGTMFVKIHDHRCSDTPPGIYRGRHWFYDYHVVLTDDSTSDSESDSTNSKSSSNSDSIDSLSLG